MMENWKIYKLGDVIVSANTGLDAIKRAPIVEEDTGIKCLRIQDVSQVKKFQNWGFCTVTPENYKRFYLQEGEIIIARTGNTIGVNMFIHKDIRSVFNNGLIRIRIDRKVCDPKYVYYNFRTNIFKAYIQSIAFGTSTQPNMQINSLLSFEFKVPPVKQQESIASILSAIDDKIELNLQMNKTLEEMAMTLYKHWFVDFGPFQEGEFVESELGMIPKGWEVKTIDDVVELIIDHRGKTPKKLGGDWSDITDGCFEAISAKNIKSGKIVKPDTIKFLSNKLYQKWMKDPLRDKDIILTSEAPIGEYYFILNKTDYCLSQRLFGIRSNPKLLRPELLYCFLSSNSGQQQLFGRGSGSTVQGIKQSELRKLNIIIPDMENQIQVSQFLFGYYNMMRNNDTEIQTLTTLRDTLLPKLISGEVRVKEAKEILEEVM